MDSIIKIDKLNKSFGNNKIFTNLNLEIEKNKITTIYGPSGCGKSTLLNIIGLIEPYDNGHILINDVKLPKLNSKKSTYWKRSKLSYIFQNFGLLQNGTIDANLNLGIKYLKYNKHKLKKIKEDALKQVGLNFKLNTKTYKLSGGEQQRVAIARAIIKPSEIILADEPTGSLDSNNKKEILKLLSSIKDKTIIIVSHDEYLKKISDNIIYLKDLKTNKLN